MAKLMQIGWLARDCDVMDGTVLVCGHFAATKPCEATCAKPAFTDGSVFVALALN